MKIKIQNTNKVTRIQESWKLSDIHNKEHVNCHKKECGRVIILAQEFLNNFPRFKEITLNTELTEDE